MVDLAWSERVISLVMWLPSGARLTPLRHGSDTPPDTPRPDDQASKRVRRRRLTVKTAKPAASRAAPAAPIRAVCGPVIGRPTSLWPPPGLVPPGLVAPVELSTISAVSLAGLLSRYGGMSASGLIWTLP